MVSKEDASQLRSYIWRKTSKLQKAFGSALSSQETPAESEFDNPPIVLKLHLCLSNNASLNVWAEISRLLKHGRVVRIRVDVR